MQGIVYVIVAFLNGAQVQMPGLDSLYPTLESCAHSAEMLQQVSEKSYISYICVPTYTKG
jgi:hypothetical protein